MILIQFIFSFLGRVMCATNIYFKDFMKKKNLLSFFMIQNFWNFCSCTKPTLQYFHECWTIYLSGVSRSNRPELKEEGCLANIQQSWKHWNLPVISTVVEFCLSSLEVVTLVRSMNMWSHPICEPFKKDKIKKMIMIAWLGKSAEGIDLPIGGDNGYYVLRQRTGKSVLPTPDLIKFAVLVFFQK